MKLAKEKRVSIQDRYVVLSMLNATTVPLTYDEIKYRIAIWDAHLDCSLRGVLTACKHWGYVTSCPSYDSDGIVGRIVYAITDCGRTWLETYRQSDQILREAAGK